MIFKKSLALSFSLIIVLMMSVFVYAAGTSTIPADSRKDTSQNNSVNDSTNNWQVGNGMKKGIEKASDRAQEERKCDIMDKREDRIKCRLRLARLYKDENEEINYENRVPEACRSLKNPVACISLYKKAQKDNCFKIENSRKKDFCLKKSAEILKGELKDLSKEERVNKSRSYLVLLLYDLQDRIEKANNNGAISDDDASAIINLIVEIKEDLLEGKKKAEILPKLRELRDKIKAVRNKEKPSLNGTGGGVWKKEL